MTSTSLPADYLERVYAGVLGKIIGVYLGRPFEGWSHERIVAELGEVDHYVHERFGMPLVVDRRRYRRHLHLPPRAGGQRHYDPDLTAAADRRSLAQLPHRTAAPSSGGAGSGNSTEHTAYLRLKDGIPAPAKRLDRPQRQDHRRADRGADLHRWLGHALPRRSGAGRRFGAPGGQRQPRWRGHLRRPGHRRHRGAGLRRDAISTRCSTPPSRFIPADSTIARLIHDVREWHAAEPTTGTRTRGHDRASDYGYDKYPGACHMVPNHALIILALLHGNDDFRRSLMIVNTAGWDTDCNAGNVGAILGIRNGLAGIDGSTRLARPGRRPALPLHRRRRPRHHRCRARDRTASSTPRRALAGAGADRAEGRAPASTSRCRAPSRAFAPARPNRWMSATAMASSRSPCATAARPLP